MHPLQSEATEMVTSVDSIGKGKNTNFGANVAIEFSERLSREWSVPLGGHSVESGLPLCVPEGIKGRVGLI
jgi:hypothetical protein